ncbi:MAG TPA: hypothetical protein PLJ89_00555 [Thermoleophilia bacterium]|mgnify:FL=1|jgi:hypothetical protein|nr:hypothetical protein [Acidobacteriota bacterium]OPZ45695.1 MAG: hypothetical protein BWY94_01161 [Actinobacteria bacterium ADurb.BinA094]HOU29157.1 hypothetical protein [Thermoleophilia bacterium]HQF52951.1 hypothetical protein [Thermoleophilia bacterium]HQH20584.1 hypothetical protein [Thermoleophilia bacterium]
MRSRTPLVALVTAGFIALAGLPVGVAVGVGWLRLPHVQPPGAPQTDAVSGVGAWTLLALFYLVWMSGLGVLLVWLFDRIGHHWQYHERSARPTKRARRRARATLRHVSAEEQAAREAQRRREEREARRRRDRERDEAWRRGPDGRGGG